MADLMKLLSNPVFQGGLGIMGSRGSFANMIGQGAQQGLNQAASVQQYLAELAVQQEKAAHDREVNEQLMAIRAAQEARAAEAAQIHTGPFGDGGKK